jgi:hypothetical protein
LNEHRIIKSKMKKTVPLLNDPILCSHVPETHWFSKGQLERMLHSHSVVYVKPNKGRKGIGIYRLKLLSDSICELSFKNTSKQLSFSEALDELVSLLDPAKSYLVQEGIDLATYDKCPFHIRVVMQKPMNRWQLSIMSGIVAKKENSVVTNRGCRELSIEEVLQLNDQELNPMHTLRQLTDISHQIAYILGSQLPLLLIGLDIGIDKKGKIWFIEANTKPDCSGMKKINDERSYQKYVEFKKWMRKK